MRIKQILLLSSALLLGITIFAQDSKRKDNNKNEKIEEILSHLSVTPQVGFLNYWGDFSNQSGLENFTDSENNKLGFGVLVNYTISDVLSISAGVLVGSIQGTNLTIDTKNASNNTADYGMGVLHKTNLFEITFTRINLNLSRLILKDNVDFFDKFSVNVFASQGLVSFDSKLYALNEESVNLKYAPDRGQSGKMNKSVTTFGSFLTYTINDRFDLGLESSIRYVYSDKLDA
jgi:hypothetical protein